MKIGILALRRSCDYRQIGGAESAVRRLASGLAERGHTIHYVLYGDGASEALTMNEYMSIRYCSTFNEALSVLRGGYDHVLTMYLQVRDRLRYAQFQLSQRGTAFHKVALGTPASLKEWGAFITEVSCTTRRGRVFTTSPVTRKVLSCVRAKAVLLLPPVPKDYFQTAMEKQAATESLTVTFLGRLAPEKGWKEALATFQRFRNVDGVHTCAFGYSHATQEDGFVVEEWQNGACVSQQHRSRLMYDPQGEERIREVLRRTDILLLPYRSMSGTIDPPLLLLEGMAAGCGIITRPAGQVGYVYGPDTPFIIKDGDYVGQAVSLIESIRRDPTILAAENHRIRERIRELPFESSRIIEQLVCAIEKDS